jgi:alpha-D-ribose 1-methylphosphonate 5-triphosphate synthase subunit PhnH
MPDLRLRTPLWLDPAARTPEVLEYLRFHCGAPISESRAAASFAVIADALQLPPLGSFQAGSDEYPDRSTTVIVQAGEITEGVGRRLTGRASTARDAYRLKELLRGSGACCEKIRGYSLGA